MCRVAIADSLACDYHRILSTICPASGDEKTVYSVWLFLFWKRVAYSSLVFIFPTEPLITLAAERINLPTPWAMFEI